MDVTVSSARLRAAAVTAVATLALAGCAAGQVAQTSNEVGAIDGVDRDAGNIALRGLAIEAPNGNSYAKGDSAELILVLANTGTATDNLVGISGSAITSWQSAANGAGEGNQSVALAPGSAVHYGTPNATASLRITGLKSALYPGSAITLTFRFTRAGSITTSVPVQVSEAPPTAQLPTPSGTTGE